jgi:ferredoxin
MDGIIAMSGENGPTNGIPTPVGFLAASNNILALDWMCSLLVGYDPMLIENLADALKRKIWLTSPEEIELKGDDFNMLRPTNFSMPKNVRQTTIYTAPKDTKVRNILKLSAKLTKKVIPILYYFFGIYPHFVKMKCLFCRKCIEICPARALEITSRRRIRISRNKCIRCFCCHEICPNNAVEIKRGL